MKQTVLEFDEKLYKLTEELVKKGDYKRAALLLSNKHPEDVALILDKLDEEDRIKVFKYLPVELQADVLIRLDDESIDDVLKALSEKDISELVGELDVDDAVDVLGELSDEERQKVLSYVPPDEREEVKELLKYPENSAGGLMTTDFIAYNQNLTVEEALHRLKQEEKPDEVSSTIYVVDDRGRLIGEVYLRDLLKAKPNTKLKEIVREVPSVPVDLDQEEVARLFEKYDVFSMPVVDEHGKLLGVITVDDILDVLEEEATEDIHRLSGWGEAESIYTPTLKMATKRLPWLLINLGTAFLAASVVAIFKSTIAAFAYLAVFMPVIAGEGGNTGVQTIALVVRSLALGEIDFSDFKRLFVREFIVGLIVGSVVGLVSGLVAYIWVGNFYFGLLVFLGHVGNMVAGCLAGLTVPMILKFFKQDPALASGVIVTTVTDVTGYFIFLGLATIFMNHLHLL